jgi:hypothetical protein
MYVNATRYALDVPGFELRFELDLPQPFIDLSRPNQPSAKCVIQLFAWDEAAGAWC